MHAQDLPEIASTLAVAFLATVTGPLALSLPTSADLCRDGRVVTMSQRRRRQLWLQGSGLCLVCGLFMAPGPWAAVVTLPYLATCAALAGEATLRLLDRGPRPAAEAIVDGARIYLAAAALWAWAACARWPLLGYGRLLELLTAAHLHAIGFVLLTLAGDLARRAAVRHIAVALASVVAVALPLTAIGILSVPALERVAGALLAGAALGLAGCAARVGVMLGGWPRWALLGMLGMFAWTIALASLYLARRSDVLPCATYLGPTGCMAMAHGAVNVAGLTLACTCLLIVKPAPPLDAPAGRPQSSLRGGWRIGADWFGQAGLVADETSPAGLVDDLGALLPAGYGREHVAPEICAFYERTGEHAMRLRVCWSRGFGLLQWLWGRLAVAMDQLQFSLATGPGASDIVSTLLPLGRMDGRGPLRGWVRRHTDGRALYVAAYARHVLAGRPFMNIAMPLPGGNLTSVLTLLPIRGDGRGHALALTTRDRLKPSDAGIWWAICPLPHLTVPIRLPLAERLEIWAAGMPDVPPDLAAWAPADAVTVARHRVALCGRQIVTLDYAMWPRVEQVVPTDLG